MTLGEKVQSILENLHWLTDEELRKLEAACGAELQERYRQDEEAQAEGRGSCGGKHPAPAAPHSLAEEDPGHKPLICDGCGVETTGAWLHADGTALCNSCEMRRRPKSSQDGCAHCGVEVDELTGHRLDDGRRVCRWCISEVFKLPELRALARLEDEEVPF